jgi:CHASE2 domain-containing sensor protein
MEIMLLVLIQLIYIVLNQLGLIVNNWVIVFLPTIGTLVYIVLIFSAFWLYNHRKRKFKSK